MGLNDISGAFDMMIVEGFFFVFSSIRGIYYTEWRRKALKRRNKMRQSKRKSVYREVKYAIMTGEKR